MDKTKIKKLNEKEYQEFIKELIGEEEKKSMAEDVAVQKALDLVVEAAVEK